MDASSVAYDSYRNQYECEGDQIVMHKYSKGWYIKQLRDNGIFVHPQLRTHLGQSKTSELRGLYFKLVEKEE